MLGIRLSIGCEKFSGKRVKNPHFSSFRSPAPETHLPATNTLTLFGFFSVFCLSFFALSLFSPPLFLPGECPPVKMSTEAAPQMSGLQLYSRFAFAGAVCCSVTHGALTPVDV